MPRTLDETDVLLLNELQTDADRPNVELARLAGLSPAATLNRVRRLKESGVIEDIHAKLDREQAGFGLCVYVSVTLGRHEETLERRFEKVVADLPQITAAAWVRGRPTRCSRSTRATSPSCSMCSSRCPRRAARSGS